MHVDKMIHHELTCWFGLVVWVFLATLSFDQWNNSKTFNTVTESSQKISYCLSQSLTILDDLLQSLPTYFSFWLPYYFSFLVTTFHHLLLLTPLTTSHSPHTPEYSSLLSESFIHCTSLLRPCYLCFFLLQFLATPNYFCWLLTVPAFFSRFILNKVTFGIKPMSLAWICHQANISRFNKEKR